MLCRSGANTIECSWGAGTLRGRKQGIQVGFQQIWAGYEYRCKISRQEAKRAQLNAEEGHQHAGSKHHVGWANDVARGNGTEAPPLDAHKSQCKEPPPSSPASRITTCSPSTEQRASTQPAGSASRQYLGAGPPRRESYRRAALSHAVPVRQAETLCRHRRARPQRLGRTEAAVPDERREFVVRRDAEPEAAEGWACIGTAACPCRDRKSTRLNSSHSGESRMPSSA